MVKQIFGAWQTHSVKERDDVLAKICRDSASVRAGDAILIGTRRIESKSLRDELAEECATKLHAFGKKAPAPEISKLIGNQTKRDAVLKKVTPAPSRMGCECTWTFACTVRADKN